MTVSLALSVLVVWSVVVVALARRAEARAGDLRPPWVALAGTFAIAGLAVLARPATEATRCGLACIALFVASDADARTGLLLDAVTRPAAIVVAAFAVATGAAADAAGGVLVLVGTFGTIVLASRGRWMGLGDVKAMYAIGAAFGPLEALVALVAACLSGIVVATAQRRLARGREIAFGPHLAAGSAVALVAGGPLVHGVMGL